MKTGRGKSNIDALLVPHPFVLVLMLIVLVALVWRAARTGIGAFFTTSAAAPSHQNAADSAVKLSSRNSDAHYIRATILEASDLPAALREHYEAVRERPDDYALWLSSA